MFKNDLLPTCLLKIGLIVGFATSTVILFGERDKVPDWETKGCEGAAWADRGNMAGVLGLNIKFFCGLKLNSSFPFNRLAVPEISAPTMVNKG